MPRGITQEQVSDAADALVAAGERPTVERIRAHLGTGSPNTVTRMLDTWRGSLAQRLREIIQLPDVPAEAGQAFAAVWRLAMSHAESLARSSLEEEERALFAAQTSLTQERKTWELALAEARAQAQSEAQAREVADLRLADVRRLVEQQAGQLAELTRQRDEWHQRAKQLNETLEDHKARVAQERDAQAAHLRAVEDRAHAEVDRAREEAKSLQASLRRQERETTAVALRLEAALASARAGEQSATEHGARATALEQQLARMDGLPAALLAAQKALDAATTREMVLQGRLNDLAVESKVRRVAKSRKR